jgi:hypothetical protein
MIIPITRGLRFRVGNNDENQQDSNTIIKCKMDFLNAGLYSSKSYMIIQKNQCRVGLFFGFIIVRASASHCQIDYKISFDNYHLNFRNTGTRQN